MKMFCFRYLFRYRTNCDFLVFLHFLFALLTAWQASRIATLFTWYGTEFAHSGRACTKGVLIPFQFTFVSGVFRWVIAWLYE